MRSHALVLASLLSLLACRAEQPTPAATQPHAQAETPTPTGPDAGTNADTPAPAGTPAPASAPTPEHEAKLADLTDMCTALNRDYGDGTLGDYYGKLTPRSEWGKQQIAAGNESMQPGRLLERAITELTASPPEPCRKLLDYLDEVE